MPATVVLVHGAWHGAWCWDGVVAGLRERRVPVVAVDLPSHGPPGTDLADFSGDADAVRSVLDGISTPVVLCGHSYGGAVITDVGVHPSVAHLVYLCAFALDAGESCMNNDLTGGEDSDLLAAVLPADRALDLDRDLAVRAFYADCARADARDAAARLTLQSLGSLGGVPGTIAWRERPSTYVVCTQDRAIPVALQRVMAARCGTVVEWPTSHSPFLSRPELVVDLLADVAARAS